MDWSSVRLKLEPFEGTAARALTELEENLKETFAEEMKKLELKRVQQFAVNLTLDTDTAQVNLSVSKDLKQVHHTDQRKFSDSPQRFVNGNILTKQSFSSGRFYFEVQVKDKTMWVFGVAKESVDRKKSDTLNSKYGYWSICLESRNVFINYNDPCVSLSLKRAPQKVGVFVDYDKGLGLVSFYDADTADLIYSFTDCSFREKLFPFLNPTQSADPLSPTAPSISELLSLWIQPNLRHFTRLCSTVCVAVDGRGSTIN
uniref:B30.2/SPRY domain-containing protein n=1 Tax=Neogobius melanostomus TaxID=47308 RepID=A0A8C6TK11_9GOBI